MKIQRNSERGQVLVLMVLGLVALMGFTALAIDGGMVYSDRRYDQSAADSASLAGAGIAGQEMDNNAVYFTNFVCGTGAVNDIIDAALAAGKSRASSNLFTLDEDLSDNMGIEVICTDDDETGAYKDKYLDVHTRITSETKTAFAHLVFGGKLKNTVDSWVRVRPRRTEAFGYAIVATRPDCQGSDGGVEFDGSGGTLVNGGGIFSAACLTMNGGGNVEIDPAEDGMIRYTTDYGGHGGGSIIPSPTQATTSMPEMRFTTPNCNDPDLPDYGSDTDGGTLQPGKYDHIKITGGEEIEFTSGLYCLYGDVDLSGASAVTVPDALGQMGVTFYFVSGSLNTNADIEINLQAPMSEMQSVGGLPTPVTALLIYLKEGNSGQVDLQGGSGAYFLGTVYAPNGQIDVGGGSGVGQTYNTQLIGETVKVHGNTTIDINFNTSQSVSRSPGIEMLK